MQNKTNKKIQGLVFLFRKDVYQPYVHLMVNIFRAIIFFSLIISSQFQLKIRKSFFGVVCIISMCICVCVFIM